VKLHPAVIATVLAIVALGWEITQAARTLRAALEGGTELDVDV